MTPPGISNQVGVNHAVNRKIADRRHIAEKIRKLLQMWRHFVQKIKIIIFNIAIGIFVDPKRSTETFKFLTFCWIQNTFNPSVPDSPICFGCHWRYIDAFRPLRRDYARLRDRRMLLIVSETPPSFSIINLDNRSIYDTETTTLHFYNLSKVLLPLSLELSKKWTMVNFEFTCLFCICEERDQTFWHSPHPFMISQSRLISDWRIVYYERILFVLYPSLTYFQILFCPLSKAAAPPCGQNCRRRIFRNFPEDSIDNAWSVKPCIDHRTYAEAVSPVCATGLTYDS